MNERRIIQTGIDVSRYQGKIDWARVKAGGTGFAIIKCTQGVNTVDPEFHRNMRNCAPVGLPVGAYVYSKARTAFAAAEEAERAAEECAPYHLDYPIAMDFEAAPVPCNAEKNTRRDNRCILYANRSTRL